jgi:hypothetical protein
MLGRITLVAEQQQGLRKALETAKADALAAFDRMGFLESLSVCVDEDRALARHQVCAHVHAHCLWSTPLLHPCDLHQ